MSPEAGPAPARPGPRRRKIRLLWTLLFVLLLTALVPLGLMAYKLIDINRESLESASREYQLEVASSIVQDLTSAIHGAQNQLWATSHYIESQLDGGREGGELRGDENLAPYLTGEVLLLRYTSREGTILEVGDRTRTKKEAVAGSLFEAFATSMGGDAFVGRPAAGETGRGPCVVAAVPVKVRDQIRGVLAAVVDLGDAWDRSVASLSSHYITFAMDDSENLFASAGMPEAMMDGEAYRRMEIVTRFRRQGAGVTEIIPFDAY